MNRSPMIALLATCIAIAGCAESTLVRSYPPGARAYLNGQPKGITPIVLTVPRPQFDKETFQVRVEHEGYQSEERTLTTQRCAGRVVGGVFTFGILLLFKPPTCFASPQDFALNAVPGAAPHAEATPVHEATVAERLQRLQELRDRGVITPNEYDHSRQQILSGM
jgi:hypothetical protein